MKNNSIIKLTLQDKNLLAVFFNVASPLRHPLPLRTHARTLNKIQTMKLRKHNKIFARSSKTIVVLFVLQLFLLFDKTEPGESGEPGDSTDSMFQNSCESQLFDTDRCRSNFHSARSGKTIPRLCNFKSNFHSILSAAPIQPQSKLIPVIPCTATS